MAKKVIEATDKVIDVLKKAERLVNRGSQYIDQSPQKTPLSKFETNINDYTLIPARIISGNGVNGYICDLYYNGLSADATKRGLVFLANGASTIHVLPPGTILYVQKTTVSIEGASY